MSKNNLTIGKAKKDIMQYLILTAVVFGLVDLSRSIVVELAGCRYCICCADDDDDVCWCIG